MSDIQEEQKRLYKRVEENDKEQVFKEIISNMAEDMEMFLEQVIKKTNPEEYIKILEQDREDFAEEINRLNNIIDELEKYLKKQMEYYKLDTDYYVEYKLTLDKLNELKGDNK